MKKKWFLFNLILVPRPQGVKYSWWLLIYCFVEYKSKAHYWQIRNLLLSFCALKSTAKRYSYMKELLVDIKEGKLKSKKGFFTIVSDSCLILLFLF